MARNELWAQGLVVDAVNDNGGFGMKMSHRFKVGVPDLLLKLVSHPFTMVLEAKIRDKPKKAEEFCLMDEVTPLQHKNLKAMMWAGIPSGVISFMRGERGTLYMHTVGYRHFMGLLGIVRVADHDLLPRFEQDRQPAIRKQLEHFVNGNS